MPSKKQFILYLCALITTTITSPVFAQTAAKKLTVDEAKILGTKNGCFACHGFSKKIVGPAFKDVAKKYKGDAKAEAMLIEKVKKGGSGTWGPVAMTPSYPRVSEADITALVKFVLAIDPEDASLQ